MIPLALNSSQRLKLQWFTEVVVEPEKILVKDGTAWFLKQGGKWRPSKPPQSAQYNISSVDRRELPVLKLRLATGESKSIRLAADFGPTSAVTLKKGFVVVSRWVSGKSDSKWATIQPDCSVAYLAERLRGIDPNGIIGTCRWGEREKVIDAFETWPGRAGIASG